MAFWASLKELSSVSGEVIGGKGNGLIPKNVKRKYLHPCRPFFLPAVCLADWRACSPGCQE